MKIVRVKTEEDCEEIRRLFREYQDFLGIDLSFQDFEEELAGLPGRYAPPDGALFLARDTREIIGCVGVRDLHGGICEMKRLYVRPHHRGSRLGRLLAQRAIEEGIRLGYSLMRLDTLDSLTEAISLYESLGFRKADPYYNNPLPDVSYWELPLTDGQQEGKGEKQ